MQTSINCKSTGFYKMWYLPYKRFAIRTTLSPGQVKQKLTKVVTPKPLIGFRDFSRKPYQGKIKGYEFKVYRIFPWPMKGGFPLLVIKGKIRVGLRGSFISAIIYPDIPNIVMSSFSLFIVFIFLQLGSAIIGPLHNMLSTGASLYTILLALTGRLILWYGFWCVLLIVITQERLQHSEQFFQKLFEEPDAS